jgi:uncharacterized protein YjbJ (UPF0337 family)
MDKDRIEGIGHEIKGAVTAGLGRIIGDAKLQSDGAAESAAGKAQREEGAARDAEVGLDADRVAGVGHQLMGAVRQGVGRIIGDPGLAADGAAEQEKGRIQNEAGCAKEAARDKPPAEPPLTPPET